MDVVTAINNYLSSSNKGSSRKELSDYLNHLVVNDFQALIQILYRVDVSEAKVKTVLQQNPQANAGDLITELLIERQEQKNIQRQNNPSSNTDAINNEERW